MAKCETCRKAEVLDTKWDKLRLWLMKKMFRNDYEDLRAEFYTQGIGTGYKLGFEQSNQLKVDNYEELAKAKTIKLLVSDRRRRPRVSGLESGIDSAKRATNK